VYYILISPTVYEAKNLKFKIYFKDHNPPHVHVIWNDAEAVFLLKTSECIENNGFSARAINQISKIVSEKAEEFLEAWHEYQK
jgi:hypothetical protein